MTSERKHILFIQPKLEGVGGIEKVVPTVAEALSRDTYVVSTLVFYGSVPTAQKFWRQQDSLGERLGGGVVSKLLKITNRFFSLIKEINTSSAELVIVSAHGAAILILLARKLHLISKPVFVYVHESVAISSPVYRLLIRSTYRVANGCICISQGIQREMVTQLGVDSSKTVVAYNGVSLPTSTSVLPESDGYERPFFFSASRLEYVKGVDRLVNWFVEYAKEGKGTLFLYGDGSLVDELREMVVTANMSNRIIVSGRCDNLPAKLMQADFYLSCARSEGFGMSLLESLAAGVPFIATDVPYGPREILGITATTELVYPAQTPYGLLCSTSENFVAAINKALSGTFIKTDLQNRAAYFSVENQKKSIANLLERV